MIRIELADDPRMEQYWTTQATRVEALLELHEHPEIPYMDTLFAKKLMTERHTGSPGSEGVYNHAVSCYVESRANIINSIATHGYSEQWEPLQCYLKANGQLTVSVGNHRACSLKALGLPVPAVLVDPTKDFEP